MTSSKKLPYKPSEAESAALGKMREVDASTITFTNLEKEDGHKALTFDHPSGLHAGAMLREAFGGLDHNLFEFLVSQLANVTSRNGDPDVDGLNCLASTVVGIAPWDSVEALLATQMAATHKLAMDAGRRMHTSDLLPQLEMNERAFTKLTRTFLAQMDVLKKHRQKASQTILVEHVTVEDGGQAIVGSVEHKGGRNEE